MSEEPRWQWVVLGVITFLAALFGYFNAGESIALHLGFFVLYQVPLVGLIFVAFLLGMLAMFLAGLRHDMKVRRLLRERRFEMPPPPPLPRYTPPEPDP